MIGLFFSGAQASGETLRIVGSTTVHPPVAEAAEILREREGLRITMDTVGGSTGGIHAVAEGRAALGMSSRPITEEDRRRFPGVDFQVHPVGEDAISMVVSRDVWESGVRALSAEQMRDIFEGRIRNWQDLGGLDRRIVFFNKEPGRGTWEIFVEWVYGGPENAPRVNHPEVGANAEVRSKVAGTRGSLSFVSTPWADEETVYALAVRTADGAELRPGGNTAVYPLSRPIFLVTDGEPTHEAARVIVFLRTAEGRDLVRKHGFVPVSPEKE